MCLYVGYNWRVKPSFIIYKLKKIKLFFARRVGDSYIDKLESDLRDKFGFGLVFFLVKLTIKPYLLVFLFIAQASEMWCMLFISQSASTVRKNVT